MVALCEQFEVTFPIVHDTHPNQAQNSERGAIKRTVNSVHFYIDFILFSPSPLQRELRINFLFVDHSAVFV